MKTVRTYSGLTLLKSFEERFEYARLNGQVGKDTFGFDRYLNQAFYQSSEWRRVRDYVILRDNGCDLSHMDFPITGRIYIHHLNPIEPSDLANKLDIVLDPEFLVCVCHNTHNAIHYGDASKVVANDISRSPNDTCPWKR